MIILEFRLVCYRIPSKGAVVVLVGLRWLVGVDRKCIGFTPRLLGTRLLALVFPKVSAYGNTLFGGLMR